MKKIISLLIVVTVILASCKSVDVSEENMKIIGQNIASVLENYHKTDESNFDDNSQPNEQNNEQNNELNNETNSNTTTNPNNNTARESDNNQSNNGKQSNGSSPSQEEINQAKSDGYVVDQLSDENFTITYKNYEISDKYPNKPENELYAYVEALADTKLLVLKFEFTNNKDTIQDVSYIAQSTNFKLLAKNKYLFTPINTLMENDIVAGIFKVEPGQTKEAVLVFQIQDEVADNITNLILIATRPNKKELLEV